MQKDLIYNNISFKGYYKITENGEIFSVINNKYLKPSKDKDGYLKIVLCKDKSKYYARIHRLVAENFIDNENNYKFVNHKDENKQNNNVNNLEWCDSKYNANYGTRIKRYINKRGKKIIQKDKNDNIIKIWESINQAKEYYNTRHIYDCLLNKRKYAKGYKWEYYDKKGNING